MKYNAHGYQIHTTEHIIDNMFSAAFLEMGLGKTVSTLTAIDELINNHLEVSKVLIIAPKRVAEETWSSEIYKWDHLKHLTFSKILGTEVNRKKAIMKKADIYIINRENVEWLVAFLGGWWPYDMVVVDELSSFKSAKSRRFKALRQVRPKIKRLVGLTGTPAPNGMLDLWSQLYLLDMGERLGKTISSYRQAFFTPGKSNGHIVYNYRLRPEAEKAIFSRIEDICVSMTSKDYLELPERIDNVVSVKLGDETMKAYEAFEKEEILALVNGDEISTPNAAALTNKLLQFSNGAIYDEDRKVHHLHDDKMEALEELIESANGKPVLVFYSYKHDMDRIKAKFGKKVVTFEDGGTTKVMQKWNAGEIEVLVGHPASMGHGLNLQSGGHIMVWFGLPWSLELYQQAVARLDRQGQEEAVMNNILISKGTMDEDVWRALNGKKAGQEALMEAIKARIEKYSR
jgi:SNF2 family DNA or RNA helicase